MKQLISKKYKRPAFIVFFGLLLVLTLTGCAAVTFLQGSGLSVILLLAGFVVTACSDGTQGINPDAVVGCESNTTINYPSSLATLDVSAITNSSSSISSAFPTKLVWSNSSASANDYVVNGSASGSDVIVIAAAQTSSAPSDSAWPANGGFILDFGTTTTQIFAYDYIPSTFNPYGTLGTGDAQVILLPYNNNPFTSGFAAVDFTQGPTPAGTVVVINPLSATGLTVLLTKGTHKIGLANGLTFSDLYLDGTSGIALRYRTSSGPILLNINPTGGFSTIGDVAASDFTECYIVNSPI